MKYRRADVEEKMQAIEYGYEMPVIDVLSAIKKVNAAWKSVTSTTVRNCSRKAGFKTIGGDEVHEEVMDKENDLEKVIAKWLQCLATISNQPTSINSCTSTLHCHCVAHLQMRK
jgi:hypothetical protein